MCRTQGLAQALPPAWLFIICNGTCTTVGLVGQTAAACCDPRGACMMESRLRDTVQAGKRCLVLVQLVTWCISDSLSRGVEDCV